MNSLFKMFICIILIFSLEKTSRANNISELNKSDILTIIFPHYQLKILTEDELVEPTIKDKENSISIYKIFNDLNDPSIIHILTQTYDPQNNCHACQCLIGYAQLKKTEKGFIVKTAHSLFDQGGKFGRLDKEECHFVYIGKENKGFILTGEDIHQGVVSRYVTIYEMSEVGPPRKVCHFFIEPFYLKNIKIYFEENTITDNKYFDLIMEGKDVNYKKRIYRWNRESFIYKISSEVDNYYPKA